MQIRPLAEQSPELKLGGDVKWNTKKENEDKASPPFKKYNRPHRTQMLKKVPNISLGLLNYRENGQGYSRYAKRMPYIR